MKRLRWMVWSTVLTLGSAAFVAAETAMMESRLPAYERVSGIAGNLNSVGSDTLNNLMTF